MSNILKRVWLLDHFDILLREAHYHKGVEVEENLPGTVMWHLGQETGEYVVAPRIQI